MATVQDRADTIVLLNTEHLIDRQTGDRIFRFTFRVGDHREYVDVRRDAYGIEHVSPWEWDNVLLRQRLRAATQRLLRHWETGRRWTA